MDSKKKTLLFFPGDLTSSFVINELPWMVKLFDRVVVIDFGAESEKRDEIIKQYPLEYRHFSSKDVRPKHLIRLFGWLWNSSVRREIRSYGSLSAQGLKRIGYILYYGLFYILIRDAASLEIQAGKDEIYVYSYWLSRSAFCAANIREQFGDRITYAFSRAHRYDLYLNRNQTGYLPFRRYITQHLDDIYFISEDGRNYYKEEIIGGNEWEGAGLLISRLGSFRKGTAHKAVIPKEEIVIVSCSQINEVKRIDLIIEMIACLQQAGFPVKWHHLGDGHLREIMETRAKEKLKKNSYEFLGWVDNAVIPEQYQKLDADYFINMSDSEGVPVSIMEALAFGLPVIARDVGGMREIVDETCGCLLPEEYDAEMYGKQICDFVKLRRDDAGLYQALSDGAGKQWEERYSAEKNYNEFYEMMLKEKWRN